jgi:hypothetical protein
MMSASRELIAIFLNSAAFARREVDVSEGVPMVRLAKIQFTASKTLPPLDDRQTSVKSMDCVRASNLSFRASIT